MSAHVTAMHAHSPASYSLSLMIHGGIAAILLATAYLFNDARNHNNGIFVVVSVAGPGDNWPATEAPAPDTVTFTPPPVTPPPAPVPEALPEPAQTQTPVTSIPRDALVVPPPKTKQQPKKQPAVTPTQTTSKTMSIDEFNKLYAKQNQNARSNKAPTKVAASTTAPVTAPRIASPGKSLLANMSGSTSGAPTAAERDQMDAYFNTLADRIKQAHEKPEGVSMELVTRVEYQVAADGTIGAVKILRSSGNRAFDESVLKAFRSVRGIGPRPDGRSGAKIADFRMKEE